MKKTNLVMVKFPIVVGHKAPLLMVESHMFMVKSPHFDGYRHVYIYMYNIQLKTVYIHIFINLISQSFESSCSNLHCLPLRSPATISRRTPAPCACQGPTLVAGKARSSVRTSPGAFRQENHGKTIGK